MFSQPNLSQSKQPSAHYDYDGLSGGWLWFPWWVHIGVAILAWPLSWWLLPMLPFQNPKISEFLFNYRIQIASAISILTVMTAFLSYLKAYRIRNRKQSSKISTKPKKIVNANSQKDIQKDILVSVAKPKAKKAVKKVEENSVAEAKPKKITKKSSEGTRKASKASDLKSEKKPVAKKKRTTTKKKDDQQGQLDL